jgi:hypothetical protein
MFMQLIERPLDIRANYGTWRLPDTSGGCASASNNEGLDFSTQGVYNNGWNNNQNNRTVDVIWPALEQLYQTTMAWQNQQGFCTDYSSF